MRSTSQGLPNTWVATMALVSGAIRASISPGFRFQVSGSMSAKIGRMPSHCSELVVATKLKGVVIALPVIPSAR